MIARPLASSLLAAALVLPMGVGCNKKPQLTEVEVPDAGVTLRYDLAPGQEYAGHIKMRSSAQTPMGDMVTSVEFDVALMASGKQEEGATLLYATIKNIDVSARMPEGIPAAAAGINPEAASALNGMELRFNLSPRGEVKNVPDPPEAAAPEIKGMIAMITTALTAGLAVRLPEEPQKGGASWDSTSKELDEDVTSAKSTGTLEGLARNEAGEDIAQLVFTATTESERSQGGQSFQVKQQVDTKAAFSSSGGYPATIERKINNEIVGQATILIEIDAQWSKGGKQDVAVEASSPPANDNVEVQEITDPCDPDYVGMEECVDEAAPADDAAEADGEGDEAAKADG